MPPRRRQAYIAESWPRRHADYAGLLIDISDAAAELLRAVSQP